MSTHSSSLQNVNSSSRPVNPPKRHTFQSSTGQRKGPSINSYQPENRGLLPYNMSPPALPQPQAGDGPQHFDPYPLYSQSHVAASPHPFTYPVNAMGGGINQPYQPYNVTGHDLLFGLQPNEYSHPRKLIYPYNSVSNSFERDIFPRDPRLTAQQQVPVGMPQFQPSQYSHPTQLPINPPVLYSPFSSSASFTPPTQSIGLPRLKRTRQPSYRPSVFPASAPKEPSQDFGSDSLLESRGPPRKPKQSDFALWVGNLPGDVQIGELKDFFGTEELESILLMKKSNCAFVNYKTEASREKALSQFNNAG